MSLHSQEILQRIFRHANYSPPFLSYAWLAADDLTPKDVSATLSSALRTRRTITLVSQLWHEVGLKLMYQEIYLSTLRQLLLLIQTLEASRFKPHGYGEWVQSVSLGLNLLLGVEAPRQPIQRLLELCPGLVEIANRASVMPRTSLNPTIVTAICQTNFRTVKSVIFDSETLEVHDLARILDSCPGLKNLAVGHIGKSDKNYHLQSSTLESIFVRVLHTDWNFLSVAATAFFPSLSYLVVANGLYSDFPVRSLERFLVDNGGEILSFEWRNPFEPIDISFVLDTCPRINKLTFSMHETPCLKPSTTQNYLTHVYIRELAPPAEKVFDEDSVLCRMGHLHDHLFSFSVDRFPVLSAITALDMTVSQLVEVEVYPNNPPGGSFGYSCPRFRYRFVPMWSTWQGWLADRGVQFVDKAGDPVLNEVTEDPLIDPIDMLEDYQLDDWEEEEDEELFDGYASESEYAETDSDDVSERSYVNQRLSPSQDFTTSWDSSDSSSHSNSPLHMVQGSAMIHNDMDTF